MNAGQFGGRYGWRSGNPQMIEQLRKAAQKLPSILQKMNADAPRQLENLPEVQAIIQSEIKPL